MNFAFSFDFSLIMPAYYHPVAYKTACSTFQGAKLSKTSIMACYSCLCLVGYDLHGEVTCVTFMPKLLGTFGKLMVAYGWVRVGSGIFW